MNKKRVAFKTLGCRLNQFETDSIITDFSKAGYEIVPFHAPADVYIVNTCTVTNQSDQKSKNTINQAVRHAGDGGLTIVTGCMVTSQKEYLENRSDLTYVVGNKEKSSVFPLVDAHLKGEILHPNDLKQDLFNFTVVEDGLHTRSMIKIQDGCNNYCTYCIVPKVRGRANSRPVQDVLDNIRQVVDLGRKEVVLTGVNISRYRSEGVSFEDLIEKILVLPGDFRVRISSMEPEGFTEKFIDLFQNPKLCQHLHLCLQSGSEKVLDLMRRFYSIDQYRSLIDTFRNKYPNFNFTTDIIVGFPGETEELFAESYKTVREIGFGHIHTFKYSVRRGTLAEKMPGQVNEKVKTERSELIRQLSDESKYHYRQSLIGKEQMLLVEKPEGGLKASGYGENFVPVWVKGHTLKKNSFQKVIISEVLNDKDKTVLAKLV